MVGGQRGVGRSESVRGKASCGQKIVEAELVWENRNLIFMKTCGHII